MPNWWTDEPAERFWCEVTDRPDIGADLKAPKVDDAGQPYWGYSLLKELHPGDFVFHYSTQNKAFVGISVAGGPVEDRPIVWRPHGTSGRAAGLPAVPRPGWWRPLYGFTPSAKPLSLQYLKSPAETAWISEWKEAKESEGRGKAKITFQCRRDGLRGGQGYMFKMPSAFVARWGPLHDLVDEVEEVHESLGQLDPPLSPDAERKNESFDPKDDSDYEVIIRGGKQRRTRGHESLVREAGLALQAIGATVATPHPIDLLITSPREVIVEAKTTGKRSCLRAVREAVGQLFEYRCFLRPDAELAILLDATPDNVLINYVERDLGISIYWWSDGRLNGPDLGGLIP